MSAGDRPHLPLATEPMTFLRAGAVGRPLPGPVQPVEHRLALEEEPALRVHLVGPPAAADPTPPTPPSAPPPFRQRTLPATGASLPLPVAVGAVGLAWLLRKRHGDGG